MSSHIAFLWFFGEPLKGLSLWICYCLYFNLFMMMLTKRDLLERLSKGQLHEDEAVEFKESWQRDNGKSLSAIGNRKQGGWLIVGVNDSGYLIDRDSGWIKKQKNTIESQIRNLLKPSATAQFVSIEELDGKKCLFIEIVNPGASVSWNGKFYKRTGSQTSEMSPGEKRSLELKRPGFDFSDFDYDREIDSSLVLDFAKF